MKIYYNNTFIEIQPNDEAYRSRQIMGEDALTLTFEYQGYLDIPVGAYCVFGDTTYYLLKPENFKKDGERRYSYELYMESDAGRLKLYRLKNTVDGRLKFEMNSKPEEYLQMIVDNMNLRDSGWTVGNCVISDEKMISFNHNRLSEALDTIAETFDTEWSINGKTINLGKVRANYDSPIELSYGKGNGFVPGLGRANADDSSAFEILYVQGGERNIDYSTYGNKTLLLPKSKTIRYDGKFFENEAGFNIANSRQYITDATGTIIRRNDRVLSALAPEDSFDNSEAYPKRVGTVSEWICVDAEKHLYDFKDSSIPQSLDYNQYMIEGETMTVKFQSGMLAGREFEINEKGYDHATRRFQIVPADMDGQAMPSDVFKAAVGDKYVIYGCTLPNAYICDDSTKTGASWDLFKEAVRYMYEHEDSRFTFDGILDGHWAASRWSTIGPKIVLGGTVLFSDTQFLQEGENIRIVGIKDYLNKPKYPELSLSNATVTSSIATELNEYKAEEVVREKRIGESVQFTKRRWRDLKETAEMLEAAIDNYSSAINPISVQTMQLIAGDEALQFRFVTSKTAPAVDTRFGISYDVSTKKLSLTGGLTAGSSILQHMTIGVNAVSSEHTAAEYHFWDIPQFQSSALSDTNKKYYVYAKCSKTASTGQFLLSEQAIKMEQVDGFYHFLIGILNSEYEGTRSFAQMYGYTEVLPGRITTDRICSADGINFFDLVTGEWCMSMANDAQYIKVSQQQGVRIKAKVEFVAGSTGLGNVEGYNERQDEIDDAIAQQASDLSDFADATRQSIQDLQDQIDDSITTWYLRGVPTLTNAPANEWTTDELKKKHIGDLYYDKDTGLAYRFLQDGTYKWIQIRDEAIGQALAAAARAQDTADGKRVIFFTPDTPTGEHQVGDMWSNGEELKVWDGSDWVDSNTYASRVDLEALEQRFDTTITEVNEEMEAMRASIQQLNDDSILDDSEKSYVRTSWENINGIASLTQIGSEGSYAKTLDLISQAGPLAGQDVKLTFNGQTIVFNGQILQFHYTGLGDLQSAYFNLRDYLASVKLYSGEPTYGFNREHLAYLFTRYYDAQRTVLDISEKYYADKVAKTTLQNFIDGEYADDLEAIMTQVDKKAEAFVQPTNPAADWTTTEQKEQHLSDMWWNNSLEEVAGVAAGATAIYSKNGSTYYWKSAPVPQSIFDSIDGKSALYVQKPTSYKERDMWIIESGLSAGDMPADCTIGDLVVATSDSTSYNKAHWKKKVKYTDDSALTTFINGTYSSFVQEIKTQVDSKSETWVQSSDPATAWTTADMKKAHVGDMWLNSSRSTVSGITSMGTAIYQLVSGTYKWVEKNVPNELFDQIDGKCSLFLALPTNYHANDLWIIGSEVASSNIPAGCSVGDMAVASSDSSAYNKAHWSKKVKYTDDTALEQFIQNRFEETVSNLQQQLSSAKDAIDKMNNDHILDETEKGYIRTQWEMINGLPSFSQIGEEGSYKTTLDLVIASGYTDGEATKLLYSNYSLTFNGYVMQFQYRGVNDLKACYLNLRDYLARMDLYGGEDAEGFDREYFALLISMYYDAQSTLIDRAQKFYAYEVAKREAEQFSNDAKDALARDLGYSSFADMAAKAAQGNTIINGGFLRTSMIDVDALIAQSALIEKLWSSQAFIQRLEAVEATVQKLTVGKLDTLPSDSKSKIMAEGNQIVMLDASGTKKFRVFDGYIGMYDDLRLTKDLNYLSSPLQLTRAISSYVPQSNTPKYLPDELVGFLNMGWCDKGSTLQINSVRISMTVPYDTNGRSINFYANAPTYRVCLYDSNGVEVESWLCSALSPTYGSSGTTINATLNLNTTITIDEDSNYTLRVYTYRKQGPVVQTSTVYWTSSYGSANISMQFTTSFYIKLTRSNYEYTHIGRDGLMQVFGDGYLFSDGTDFVVKRGNYMLRLKSLVGIQKSTNGGQSWTSL